MQTKIDSNICSLFIRAPFNLYTAYTFSERAAPSPLYEKVMPFENFVNQQKKIEKGWIFSIYLHLRNAMKVRKIIALTTDERDWNESN